MTASSSHEFATDCAVAPRLARGEATESGFAAEHPLRLLVAEDNYINRQLLLAMVRGLGYQAFACENGNESFTVALLGNYDVFLCDLDLLGINGLECAQKLREAGVDVNIIAMIGSSPDASRTDCLAAGMDDCLIKPVCLEDLKRVLRFAFLDRRGRN